MNHKFKFFRARENVEKFRVNVSDPLNGDSNMDPSTLNKIELVVNDVVVSSSTNEITWIGDVIQIRPTTENLALLARQSYSELVVYNGGEGITISTGYVFVV